jgi:DNA-binding PucR family transcriptional regulator
VAIDVGIDVPAWYRRVLELIDAGAHAEAERVALDVEDYHRRRESELLALYETARDLTALRDTDRVLRAIVRRARQLLGSDVSYLSLFDEERQDFYVRSVEGTSSDAFARMRARLGVGICGAVAVEKQPRFSSDYANDPAFTHDDALDRGITGEHVTSILGVPLLAEEQVIGVLFVADRVSRAYTRQQIALLDSLGAHAAVAIETARLFQESQAALARERVRSAEVQSAAEVHEQLTSLLAGGGDLPELAEVLAGELRGRVTIVDDTPRALCGELDVPAGELRDALRRSREGGRSVRLPGATVAAAYSQGGVVLQRAGELSPAQLRTLERGAMMVALVLLARERVATAQQRAMSELVHGLLKRPQEDLDGLRREARRHGLDPDAPVVVIVLDVGDSRSSQLVQTARAALAAALVAQTDDTLTVLAPASADPRRVRDAVQRAAGEPVTAIVSDGAAFEALPDVHRRAVRGLALMLTLGRGGTVARACELAPYAAVFGDPADAEPFMRELLAPLLDAQTRRSAQLAETLLTYFDCGRSTADTAARLHIHANTLRQRLEKISTLIPGWDSPEHALDLHLALRLHALRARRHS